MVEEEEAERMKSTCCLKGVRRKTRGIRTEYLGCRLHFSEQVLSRNTGQKTGESFAPGSLTRSARHAHEQERVLRSSGRKRARRYEAS